MNRKRQRKSNIMSSNALNKCRTTSDQRKCNKFSVNTSTFCVDLNIVLLIFVASVCWWSSSVDAIKQPQLVHISKCCRIGDHLDANNQCIKGSTEQWWPVIYLVNRKETFNPHGEAPRFFKPREHSQPICDHVERIDGSHNIALFSNGSLFLAEQRILIDAGKYCVDKDSALVCSVPMHMRKTRIRKCCDENLYYAPDDETKLFCRPIENANKFDAKRKFIQKSDQIEYIYGYPKCSDEGHAIVGQFNESKLDIDSGNLSFVDRSFHSDQYCLALFNDSDAGVSINVLTCAKYLTPSVRKVSKMTNFFLLIFV